MGELTRENLVRGLTVLCRVRVHLTKGGDYEAAVLLEPLIDEMAALLIAREVYIKNSQIEIRTGAFVYQIVREVSQRLMEK